MIDLRNNERKYILEHRAFAGCNTVVKTMLRNKTELFIFVNGPNPEILLLDLEKGDMMEVIYKPQPNFIDVGFYNET